MTQAIVVNGTLTNDRTIALDETVSAISGRVRIVLEPMVSETKATMPIEEFEKMLRARQAARGHVPRTKEEVDAYIKEERESWDF